MPTHESSRLLHDLADRIHEHGSGHPAVEEAIATLPEGPELGPVLAGALDVVEDLLGRDVELDSVLLSGLGDVPRPEAAALVQRFTDAGDRRVAKAARRALHRLRSRGIEIPQETKTSTGFSLAIDPDVRAGARSWRTGVDGNGARIVWVLTPSESAGHRLLEVVVDDGAGIRRAHVTATTRKALRAHLDGLRAQPAVLLAAVPPPRAAGILVEAERRSEDAGEDLPATYREWRSGPPAALFEGLDREATMPTIYRQLSAEDVRGDPALLETSAELLGDDAFANWAHLGPAAERAARRVREAEESRLTVDDDQRKELIESAMAGAADDFDDDLRRRYRQRLEAMASVLWQLERHRDARRALAAAVGFTEIGALYQGHPFARALVQRGVFVAYQRRQDDGDGEGSGRIVRP